MLTRCGAYAKLAAMYARQHDASVKLEQTTARGAHGASGSAYRRRVVGTYFRVGFYGRLFGDEQNGVEYVYREPAITKLPEVAHRLEALYAHRFGAHRVEVLKDSQAMSAERRQQLDATAKAYIQITYVEPYWYRFEERRAARRAGSASSTTGTVASRLPAVNIRRFVYSTPYTHGGRSHGELGEQRMRKTILTVEHVSFVSARVRDSNIMR